MESFPRICVIIPVFNHGLTIQEVVRGAKERFPVLVVNDGSTDQTGSVLRGEADITLLTFPRNLGKASALAAGFEKARALGFSHAITLDADGQHPTTAIADFAESCRRNPDAIIVGARDLKAAAAPLGRRISNALSNFWFRFETGVRLEDTQCGYRVYPLDRTQTLCIRSARYAYELELLVKAAWAGLPLVAQRVQTDYAAPTSRLSHFHPLHDFLAVSRVHARLSTQAFCIPAPLRKLTAAGDLTKMPRTHRLRTIFRHLYHENTESPGRLAAAVGVGLFCGIAPIWGAQMLAAAVLAHKFKLNKAIALTASNVSFPLAAPFILAAGLMLGHFLWTGRLVLIDPQLAAQKIPLYLCEWFFGSLVLACLTGALGASLTLLAAVFWDRQESTERHE